MDEVRDNQATKTCPECAEQILAEAMICRFCGYDYRTGTRPGASPAVPAATGDRPTNGYAIASLVLGILWLWGIGSIAAIVFGKRAQAEIDLKRQSGRGMATAGVVLGWIGLAGLAVTILLMVSMASGVDTSDEFRLVGECLMDPSLPGC